MPRNIVTAIVPMIASVVAAFFACGRLKAGTPLEIASTPVSAVAPCENAFRSAKIVIPATAVARVDLLRNRDDARAAAEALARTPTPISTRIETTKP